MKSGPSHRIALLLIACLGIGPALAATGQGPAAKRLTIAILWFENKSAEPQVAHWRYSVPGLLRVGLRQVKALRALSQTAVDYAFRQLNTRAGAPLDAGQAQKMGEFIEAQRVVWGSYCRKDNQWRVRAHIVNVATGEASAELTAVSDDWFQVRDDLAGQILEQLRVTASDAERQKMNRRWTSCPAAFEWFSKAFSLQQENKPLAQQEQCARKAVAADPQCAEAHGALAATLGSQGRFDEAEAAIRQALQIEPDYADAHETFGVLLLFQKKLQEAERELREAHRLGPDDSGPLVRLGQFYSTEKDYGRALDLLDKARARDPFDASIHANLGYVYVFKRNRTKAMLELQEAERLDPEGIYAVNAEQMICQAYMMLGEIPQAIDHFDKFLKLARPQNVNPKLVSQFEEMASHLKASLTATFIEASMPNVYTEQTLQEELRNRLTSDQLQTVVNPLATTDKMKSWARQLTAHVGGDLDKAKALFDGLTRRIEPEGGRGTRTAQQVFAAWNDPNESFSCQEYAKLFLALARDVDLKAFYVHLDKDYKGRTVNHDCTVVFAEGKALLVDPAYRWFGVPHEEFVVLDDLQTIAHHFFQPRDVSSRQLAAKLHPDFAWGQLRLAKSLLTAGQTEQAHKALQAAVALEPDRWDVHQLQGLFALEENDAELAAEHLEKALTANPNNADSHFLLAAALLHQNKLKEARERYRASLRHRPSPNIAEKARRAIALINERIGVEDPSSTRP